MRQRQNSRRRFSFRRTPSPRRLRIAVLTGLAILLAWTTIHDRFSLRTSVSDQSAYHEKRFRVIRVIDGDTLDLDVADRRHRQPTTRVRLWGVDTPETQKPDAPAMHYGPEAAQFTERLALNTEVLVRLEPFAGSRDKYGRLLAYIYLPDGRLLNQTLIQDGYGYADERFTHMLYDEFLAAQKEARENHRGLWRDAAYADYPSWYRNRHTR